MERLGSARSALVCCCMAWFFYLLFDRMGWEWRSLARPGTDRPRHGMVFELFSQYDTWRLHISRLLLE